MNTAALHKNESTKPAPATVNQYTFTPRVDIRETENGYNLEVEMPGVDKDGIDVNLEDGVLTILGRVQPDNQDGFEKAYAEYEVGNYERQFQISEIIDEEQIEASVKNGILTLELPKHAAAKPKRIEVKVG